MSYYPRVRLFSKVLVVRPGKPPVRGQVMSINGNASDTQTEAFEGDELVVDTSRYGTREKPRQEKLLTVRAEDVRPVEMDPTGPVNPYFEREEATRKRFNKRVDERIKEDEERARQKKLEGVMFGRTAYGNVSPSCDTGHCVRCASEACECGCHQRRAREVFKRCGCGRAYTKDQWLQLPFIGEQQIEATETEPAEVWIARNCQCGSTLMSDRE